MALESYFSDLRDAVNEMHHVLPELTLEFFWRSHGVLERIMQQSGNDGGDIRLQRRQHARDRDGMLQIGLARASPLPLMHLGGKLIGFPHDTEVRLRVIALHAVEQLLDVHDRLIGHQAVPSSLMRRSRMRSWIRS